MGNEEDDWCVYVCGGDQTLNYSVGDLYPKLRDTVQQSNKIVHE